jgi:hypothetical protein
VQNKIMSQLELEQKLFALPIEARADIAHRLLESLSNISEEESDRLWAEVSLERINELKQGKVQGISGEEALRRAREALR